MAIARISKRYPDASAITVEVEVRDSYPDALDQAVTEVVRLWSLTPNDADDGDDGDE